MTTPDHTPYLAEGDLRTPEDVTHELGHAMGLDHVDEGVMARSVDLVEARATADDWRAFCSVHRCSEAP